MVDLLFDFINNKYEKKLISSGNNYPSINLSKDFLDIICVLLHKSTPLNKIQDVLSLTQEQLKNRLEILKIEGLVKEEKDMLLPTFPVISKEEGDWLKKLCMDIGVQIVDLIKKNIERVIDETFKLSVFQKFSFEEISLLILSGVLLDFIQIDNVEELFLKSSRTYRNNKNYYYSIMEIDKDSKKEAFEIYGNHCENIGQAYFCLYGNERYTRLNFVTLTVQEGIRLFGDIIGDTNNFKNYLLKAIIENQVNRKPLDKRFIVGLEKLSIFEGERLISPIINEVEYQALYDIADVIKNDLIKILNSNCRKLMDEFNNSLYKNETTFEEFFIWYYHFLYSYVTDELMKKRLIITPKSGLFNYILI